MKINHINSVHNVICKEILRYIEHELPRKSYGSVKKIAAMKDYYNFKINKTLFRDWGNYIEEQTKSIDLFSERIDISHVCYRKKWYRLIEKTPCMFKFHHTIPKQIVNKALSVFYSQALSEESCHVNSSYMISVS